MKKITILIALTFVSFSASAQVLLTETFDSALNWTVAHTSGSSTSAGWIRVTAGTFPTCSPFSGAGMAQFNSYDAEDGNVYTLTSPSIAFGGLFYKVNFNLYRDGGYSTSEDNVKVYYNSTPSLSGASLLTTVNRSMNLSPVVFDQDWYNYDAYLPYGTTGNGYIIIKGTSGYGNNMYMDNITIEQVNTVNDAELNSVNLNPIIALGTYPIQGTFRNLGSNTMTSIDINWQQDGGTVYTQSLNGLNILPGQSYNYNHTNQWIPTTGQHLMNVWVSNTNGGDTNASNDSIEQTIYVVNEIFPKTVVYEEATGTWCGWCVRGHIGLKDMSHYHDDATWIGIAVHNADPMVLPAYDNAIGTFISGYPSGAINRMPSEVDPGLSSLEPAYQTEVSKVPLAKIDVTNQTWNPTTRQITFDAQSIFAVDMATANYNMAAIIIENGVTGTTPTWRQRNYYTGGVITDWEGINWGAYPAYIPAATMVYNHVGRALLGGFNGVAGSVPSSVTYNTPVSHQFTHTLPATQNADNVEIVAILIDNATGQIVNAKEVELDTTLALADFTSKQFGIYPNPTTGIFNINTQNVVDITVVDVLGKVVYTAKNINSETQINLSGLQKGVYLANISAENSSVTKKIILN